MDRVLLCRPLSGAYQGVRSIFSPGLTPWAIIGGPSGAKKRGASKFPDPLGQAATRLSSPKSSAALDDQLYRWAGSSFVVRRSYSGKRPSAKCA
jgi:hypothetical protein